MMTLSLLGVLVHLSFDDTKSVIHKANRPVLCVAYFYRLFVQLLGIVSLWLHLWIVFKGIYWKCKKL